MNSKRSLSEATRGASDTCMVAEGDSTAGTMVLRLCQCAPDSRHKSSGIQRRNKHCAAGCVRLQCVSVGELHYDSGSEAPLTSRTANVACSPLTILRGMIKYARRTREVALGLVALERSKEAGRRRAQSFLKGFKEMGTPRFVEEFSLAQKAMRTAWAAARACHAPMEFEYSCKLTRG